MADTTATGRLLALPGHTAHSLGWATALLTWAGYRVDRAESAEEAVRMLRIARYDVLLLGYDSSPEDVQLSTEMVRHPDARIPTLMFMNDQEAFVPPPQTSFVPTGFMEPGFSQDELLHLVEKLRQFKQ
jgi:DNA-binding NtrC family response regulator